MVTTTTIYYYKLAEIQFETYDADIDPIPSIQIICSSLTKPRLQNIVKIFLMQRESIKILTMAFSFQKIAVAGFLKVLRKQKPLISQMKITKSLIFQN